MDSKLARRFSRMGYLSSLQTVNYCELAYKFHRLEASWRHFGGFGRHPVASAEASGAFLEALGGAG